MGILRHRLPGGPVLVPAEVMAELELIRDGGAVNMLHRVGVLRVAEAMGLAEAAAWVRAHPAAYARGIFQGFAPVDDGGA